MSHFNTNDDQLNVDEPWISAAVAQLRQPLDPKTSAQLRAIRRSALDQPVSKSRLPMFFLWGVPTLASVFAIVVSFGLWQESDNDIPLLQTAENVVLEDLSIIKASDDLEFYQSLEFLLWMEQVDNGLTKG